MSRVSKEEMYFSIATVVAKRSHDRETQVGCVLVAPSSGAVIATGYNGFVRGAPDEELPTTRPEKYTYMVHAEENLIAHCARHGIAMQGGTLYVTHSPCQRCMRLLIQAGVRDIHALESYEEYVDIDLQHLLNKKGS